jgi:hypothetical protein
LEVKLGVAWSLFASFWLIGSGVFVVTEGWAFGTSMFFCERSATQAGLWLIDLVQAFVPLRRLVMGTLPLKRRQDGLSLLAGHCSVLQL